MAPNDKDAVPRRLKPRTRLFLLLLAAAGACLAAAALPRALRAGRGAASSFASSAAAAEAARAAEEAAASQPPGSGWLVVDGQPARVPLARVAPDLPDTCGGELNLDLDGYAVEWGMNHKTDSAAECCAACRRHTKKGDQPGDCNSWVWCRRVRSRCAGRQTCAWARTPPRRDGGGGSESAAARTGEREWPDAPATRFAPPPLSSTLLSWCGHQMEPHAERVLAEVPGGRCRAQGEPPGRVRRDVPGGARHRAAAHGLDGGRAAGQGVSGWRLWGGGGRYLRRHGMMWLQGTARDNRGRDRQRRRPA